MDAIGSAINDEAIITMETDRNDIKFSGYLYRKTARGAYGSNHWNSCHDCLAGDIYCHIGLQRNTHYIQMGRMRKKRTPIFIGCCEGFSGFTCSGSIKRILNIYYVASVMDDAFGPQETCGQLRVRSRWPRRDVSDLGSLESALP